MADKELNVKMRQRADTNENWSTKNPILLEGEVGFDSDENAIKIGDGILNWNDLKYVYEDKFKRLDSYTLLAGETSIDDTPGLLTATLDGITEFHEGMTIAIKITTDLTTFNTLDINGLGPKLLWYRYNDPMQREFYNGAELQLTFRTNAGRYSKDGTTYTDGWVAQTTYTDGNTWDALYYGERIKVDYPTGRDLLMQVADSSSWAPLILKTSDVADASSTGNNAIEFAMNGTIICNIGGGKNVLGVEMSSTNLRVTFNAELSKMVYGTAQPYKPVFIVGTVVNGKFRVDINNYWTQDIPQIDNGKVYLYLGYMVNNSDSMRLTVNHPFLHYKNGGIVPYSYTPKVKQFNKIITPSNWVGSIAPYTLTIVNENIKELSEITINLTNNMSAAEIQAYQSANIFGGIQTNGSLELKAYGDKPTINIPLTVLIGGEVDAN